ncbi:MAG: effector-associated domain EAD1-containing protein [Chloroflexota bacterium]
MRLTGQQYQQLTEALLDAFPSLAKLDQMVQFRLGKNIHAIALGDDLKEIVFKVIRAAEAEGWTAQLIVAARESVPGNPVLLAFSQQFGLGTATPPRPELERIIRRANSFLDVAKWRTRLGEIETQVCRIEIKGQATGTGFLLGPDVVITNYHVMKSVIEGKQALPGDVTLRFDYKQLGDGTTLNPGTTFGLDTTEWLIDKSPVSKVDTMIEPKDKVPQPDELDYALLRLRAAVGNQSVGEKEKAEPGAPLRKWIEVPAQPYDFTSNPALYIMQHPQGATLKLALDTEAIIGVNSNQTRVTYKTNTEPGSSGSPCFNSNWELVALHHSGNRGLNPAYNEGIPLAAILALLEQRGLKSVLGEQPL